MLPGDGSAPFEDEGWFFEPWWPGVLATIVIDGGGMTMLAGQLTDPLPAFPELRSLDGQVRATTAVITGTLLVLDADGRPDAAGLRRRLTDPDDRPGMGAFIAADLLSRDGRDLTDLAFADRRGALLEVVTDGDRFLASRGLHGEGRTLAEAAGSMGIDSISARRLDAAWRPGVGRRGLAACAGRGHDHRTSSTPPGAAPAAAPRLRSVPVVPRPRRFRTWYRSSVRYQGTGGHGTIVLSVSISSERR